VREKNGVSRLASILLVCGLALVALAYAAEQGRVVQVIDGDTIKVRIGRMVETVRLIGVDTPETVDPRRPVQYFGREASQFTKRMAHGEEVTMEPDPECSDRDRYRRLLRYVYLEDAKRVKAHLQEPERQTRGFRNRAVHTSLTHRVSTNTPIDPIEMEVCDELPFKIGPGSST